MKGAKETVREAEEGRAKGRRYKKTGRRSVEREKARGEK